MNSAISLRFSRIASGRCQNRWTPMVRFPGQATRHIHSERSLPPKGSLTKRARSICRRPGSCGTMRRRLSCCLSRWKSLTRINHQQPAVPIARFRRPCFTGSRRTALPPIPAPGGAISSKGARGRMSSSLFVNGNGTAGVNPSPTFLLSGPTIAAINRNGQ